MDQANETKLAWIEAQIRAKRPPPELVEGYGPVIASLADAVGALENGRGQIFGMTMFEAELSARAKLAAIAREALEAWQQSLVASEGADGEKAFLQLASRSGLWLAGMAKDRGSPAPATLTLATDDPTLQRLKEALADSETLTKGWREAGILTGTAEYVVVRTGKPEPQVLEKWTDLYLAQGGSELPAFYRRLVSVYNGIEVQAREPAPEVTASQAAHQRLGEPTVWPFGGSYGDHFMIDADFEGIGKVFVFGEIADSGYLALDLGAKDATTEDAPVYWFPRHFASEAPTRLSKSLAGFLSLWIDCHLLTERVLERAGVPGWSG